MLPAGVDPAFRNAEHLWSAMERAEILKGPRRTGKLKRKKKEFEALLARIDNPARKRLSKEELAPAWREDAQLAYHIVLACPHKFTEEQIIGLVEAFSVEVLLPHGFIVQFAVHRPDETSPLNWHAHLLLPTRAVSGEKVGNKITDVFANFANKAGGDGFVSDSGRWPDRWAAFQLDYARRIGVKIAIPGKAAIPEPHLGKAFRLPESDLAAARAEAKADSRDAIQKPGVLAELLTETRTCFTENDARAVLDRHGVSGKEADVQIAALQDSPGLAPLFDRRDGRPSGRFTTQSARDQEFNIRESGKKLAARKRLNRRQRQLAQKADGLARQLRHPKRETLRKLLWGLANPTGFSIVNATGIADSAFLALHRLDKSLGKQLIHLAPRPTGKGRFLKLVTPIGRALRRQEREVDPRWTTDTLLLVHQADLLDTDLADRFLSRVAKTGARLVLLSRQDPRHAPGRNGVIAVLDDLFMPRLEPEDGEASEVDDWPDLIRFPPDDLRQPTLAWAAPGDPRSRKTPKEARLTQPQAPRPWRWPGADMGEILNLSSQADCEHVFRRLTGMPAEDALAIHRTLPRISEPAGKPSLHPLAGLHRSLYGHFRKAGLDPIHGGADRAPFKFLQLKNDDGMRHWTDLAPINGHVDVRCLLAHIDRISLADWEELAATAKHFCQATFEAIRAGLYDVAARCRSEEVQHAVSFALAQIYVLAKDTGHDLVPQVARDEIWSLISSAERVQTGLCYEDHEGDIEPSLALALPSFRALNQQYKRNMPTTASPARQNPTSRPAATPSDTRTVVPPRQGPSEAPSPMKYADTTPSPSKPPALTPAQSASFAQLVELCQRLVVARERPLQLRLAESIASLPRPAGSGNEGDLHSAAMAAATYLRAAPYFSPMALAAHFAVVETELRRARHAVPANNTTEFNAGDIQQGMSTLTATSSPGIDRQGPDDRVV